MSRKWWVVLMTSYIRRRTERKGYAWKLWVAKIRRLHFVLGVLYVHRVKKCAYVHAAVFVCTSVCTEGCRVRRKGCWDQRLRTRSLRDIDKNSRRSTLFLPFGPTHSPFQLSHPPHWWRHLRRYFYVEAHHPLTLYCLIHPCSLCVLIFLSILNFHNINFLHILTNSWLYISYLVLTAHFYNSKYPFFHIRR